MELDLSPRHSAAGTLDLLSPTHAHAHTVAGLSAIRQIRRSLSRSPSKPPRYAVYSVSGPASPASTAQAPRSPSGLNRTLSADLIRMEFGHAPSAHRTGLARARSRRSPPNSPLRRALGDNPTHANAALRPQNRRNLSDADQENMDCSEDACSKAPSDDAMKLDFARLGPDKLLQPAKRELASQMKSSPLKRSDGVMNLEIAKFESPRSSKRRSLHLPTHVDFNVFESSFEAAQSNDSADSAAEEKEKESAQTSIFANPASPHRRANNLRRSTLQQRTAHNRSARESVMSPSSSRTRGSRFSLDGVLPLRPSDTDSPFRKSTMLGSPATLLPLHQSQPFFQTTGKPHPLSKALTPSSSKSSVAEVEVTATQNRDALEKPAASFDAAAMPPPPPSFSRSLPIGAMRPSMSEGSSSQESFATPAGFKMARPLPQAFLSTGLISKRNRNVDVPASGLFSSVTMPDTPSKKAPPIHISHTPAPPALLKSTKALHEFGSPNTPFNGRRSMQPTETYGKGMGIFSAKINAPQHTRSMSFVSTDGDELGNSPSKHLNRQVSNDELPPTPTKSTSSTNALPVLKGKSSSLRSSLFGRRTSMGPDTFIAPDSREPSPLTGDDEVDGEPSSPIPRKIRAANHTSPHTPQESFTPPDPSNLSISMEHRGSLFNSHSFPPATPTGPRGEAFKVSIGPGQAFSSYFGNDVDTSLTNRFQLVTCIGAGEFSQVYKVENSTNTGVAGEQSKLGPGPHMWAVKKSRKPMVGERDRERKMREVRYLRALIDHEHIVNFTDVWDSNNHLYIQTEYCENGNLKDFLLQTGFKDRLDDFRIWKILLELSQGVKSIHDASIIHLDLKPANVFIDWEGVLKIGDFGMASSWPAPAGLDGEGDREYIGPEVLEGRFDKPADIFSLGMMMLEIAGNIVLPDNGISWQRLRSGDMQEVPSLTSSSDGRLTRDATCDSLQQSSHSSLHDDSEPAVVDTDILDEDDDDDLSFLRPAPLKTAAAAATAADRSHDLVSPPNFMIDPTDAESLDHIVQWMIRPDPHARPRVDQLLSVGGVTWVDGRRRAGATVYEGVWGPADSVLNHGLLDDIEMPDA